MTPALFGGAWVSWRWWDERAFAYRDLVAWFPADEPGLKHAPPLLIVLGAGAKRESE